MEASLISGAAEIEEHNARLRSSQTKLTSLTSLERKLDARITIMRDISSLLAQQKTFEQVCILITN
jgi:hypothetical protein